VAHNLYITGMEPGSGKSVVALGLMETLAGKAQRAGFFRPIAAGAKRPGEDGGERRGERDPQIELIRRRYGLELE
jgi:phosphate acetyltransferase